MIEVYYWFVYTTMLWALEVGWGAARVAWWLMSKGEYQ